MAIIKDLIIVHFQEGFFTEKKQALKNSAKQEIQKLVNIGLANNDTRIGFWLDNDVKDKVSVIPIQEELENVDKEIAPCGANDAYSLRTNEVLVTGGWFGACIKFSITSLIAVFLDNEKLTNIGTIDVRLKRKAIYDTTELLEKQSKENIQIDLLRSFDESIKFHPKVRNRGLRVQMVEGTNTFFEEVLVTPHGEDPDTMLQVTFILD